MRTLSITISDELYNALKHTASSRQISKFVSEAVQEKLCKTNEELYLAYLEASLDQEREEELKEWESLSLEGWESTPSPDHH